MLLKRKTQRRRQRAVAAMASIGLAAALVGVGSGVAPAAGVCGEGPAVPVSHAPPTDPAENFWEFEGKISDVDEAARTMTVNGATLHIPDELLVKTQNLDQETGNITLTDLVNPALPTIEGAATGIAHGTATYTPAPNDPTQSCVTFEAESVYVEFAENVLVGSFMGVAPDEQSITVAGAKVELNSDPRWPARIVDGAGDEKTFADLKGHEGLLLEAEGYYSTERGALQATIIETEQILGAPAEGTDVVAITRAQWKPNELRVNGAVSPAGTGKTVSVYRGGVVGTTCDTSAAPLGTATVAADGSWTVRNRNVRAYPPEVCAQSSDGGVRAATVEQR